MRDGGSVSDTSRRRFWTERQFRELVTMLVIGSILFAGMWVVAEASLISVLEVDGLSPGETGNV